MSSFTGLLGGAGTSASELANIELAFVPAAAATTWFPFDEDVSKKRKPRRWWSEELWEPDYTNGPDLNVYFPFDDVDIPRKKIKVKRKADVLEFPFARDISESPWFPLDEHLGKLRHRPVPARSRAEEPANPFIYLVPIWPPPPPIAFKGLGLIARVPDIDPRLKRFTQQVSDMLNSLMSGGYIRRTGFQSWIISASPTFMTGPQLLQIIETADGAGSGLDADLLDGFHASAFLQTISVITTLGTVTAGVWNATVITPTYGGTGLATLTAHAVMLGEGTSNVSFATIGTAGRLLIDQGAGVDPSFNAMSGDALITSAGVITVTKTNGVAFGTLATQSGTFSGTSSGTNTGDQTTSNSDGSITVATGSTNPVVSLAVSHANTWTGAQTFTQAAAGTIGVLVKGASSRSAPLVQLQTSAGASLGNVGACIFDHFSDGASTHTDGTEDTLYTDTTIANTLAINGDKIAARYTVTIAGSATATRRVRIYFAGIVIFDSGTITIGATAGVIIYDVTIIRATSTTARATIEARAYGSATLLGLDAATYTGEATLTGLTLTATNILKITGVAAGAGAASGDITATMATISVIPAGS